MPCDRAQLLLVDNEHQTLVSEPGQTVGAIPLTDPDSLFARCIRSRAPISAMDLSPSTPAAQGSHLAAPLVTASGTIGAIAASSTQADAFSDTDREILSAVSATAALVLLAFLDNGRVLAAARDQSRQLHAELDAALHAIPHPVIIYDKEFNFRAWNDAFVEIQGYSHELMREMGGMAGLIRYEVEELNSFPGQTYEEVWQQYRDYYKFEDFNHSYQYWPMRQKHIDRRTSRTASGGWVSVLVDITEWIDDQEKIRQAKEEAEAAARAKAAFLANMSHEIRTPLNAIIGFTQLVLRGDLTAKQRDQLTQVEGSGQLLLRILDDILDFSRIDAGMLQLEDVLFKRDDVLANVITLTANNLNAPDVDLLLSVGEGVPEVLVGDPLRLAQILLNLTNNAAKFTSSGTIVLGVGLEARDETSATLRFEVTDTGIGMETEQFERLFQAFSQGDSTTTRRYGGSGLGLAIAKALTELMGGTIGVTSEIGTGSRFHISVRFNLPGEAIGAEVPAGEARGGIGVLVIDDCAEAREHIGRAWKAAGVTVSTAADRATAEAQLRTREDPVDLVLLDQGLASPDAVGSLSAALNTPPSGNAGSRNRFLLIAVSGHQETAETAIAAADGSLPKAATPAQIEGVLSTLRGKTAGKAPAAAPVEPTLLSILSGLHVLLAEDNVTNQRVAREQLELVGVEVTIAENGRRAVEEVRRAAPDKFAAILMDLQMPELDGLSAAREIRADPAFADLPIIAMTANAFDEDRDNSKAAGMVEHIAKPVSSEKLYAVLAKHVRRGEK
ncbi:ATP-binding protein [Nisaea acidiphila]|uniref:Sensory/regulatory protein RpfC n=1 Tax=Nisaea acidiphila TaxID=1862145 RepID=A0A9J7AY54_9PROT|nr:response regulator [Nisaea acidiphila]UUX52200.1 ATP-binding protein [Nisaea acidiphila]